MTLEAFFLPTARGRRFCLFHPPLTAGQTRAAVLFVHAFGEEMNKSRRMAALQARALARVGCAVLQIDLHGCGDSAGEFADASWSSWRDDVVTAASWLSARIDAPFWLWGHRVGCLLAAQVAEDLALASNFLFWQPVMSGSVFLNQFLRLRLVGDMANGVRKGSVERWRKQLTDGEAVEVAGYTLSPALAAGLADAELRPPRRSGRVEWLDVSGKTDRPTLSGHEQWVGDWQRAGHQVHESSVQGSMFWQTSEIEECPALLAATVNSLMADDGNGPALEGRI
jgi:exosortase A-associated hydrolase 2